MADDPLPQTGITTEAPQPVPAVPASASESPRTHPEITLSQHLLHFSFQMLFLAGLWAVAFLVLYFIVNQHLRDALGFATVITIVGSFFSRSVVPALHAADRKQPDAPPQPVDSFREIVETVVFVVVLVLLLKSFVAEAFVIPTGSMAQTLWGYQKVVKCPTCGIEFPVNCSNEVDPQDGPRRRVDQCQCPNCRLNIRLFENRLTPAEVENPANIRDPGWASGDRVLVAKYVYDLLNKKPNRLDVVVFKFPGNSEGGEKFPLSGPVKKHVPINYIKRLIGLPGETIAIHRGNVYALSPDKGLRYDDVEKARNKPGESLLLWQFNPFVHHDDEKALERFRAGDFTIVTKDPDTMLAMRRLVYDHDHQPADLAEKEAHRRWVTGEKSGWAGKGKTAFEHDGNDQGWGWLRYRNVLRQTAKPELITDFMAYNSAESSGSTNGVNWASDLMVECEVAIDKGAGSFALELSRGPERFQAVFDLASGRCTLYRVENPLQPVELKTAENCLKGPGKHLVRLANFDDRLTLWIDDRLPFGDGVSYKPPTRLAPTEKNDLDAPVNIGSKGAKLTVSKLKIHRDTYYTAMPGANRGRPDGVDVPNFEANDPTTWAKYESAPVSTYYVQPGHYLCLGDNSPASSDGRSWGLVPQRLLLGRAVLVYFPFTRAGRIR